MAAADNQSSGWCCCLSMHCQTLLLLLVVVAKEFEFGELNLLATRASYLFAENLNQKLDFATGPLGAFSENFDIHLFAVYLC